MHKLFEPYTLAGLPLQNRIVMSPMTRSRAIGNLPNDLMATYYRQRNSAGLIITEGTAPSPNALGYPRIPGIYSKEQVEAWKPITAAIHEGGARTFLQIMHTGRVGHVDNLPAGAEVVGPSAKTLPGEMYTDGKGMQPHTPPRAMTKADIDKAIAEYVTAGKNAVEAGFDGVEVHGANGYLVQQFLNSACNDRTDGYGGSVENRIRFGVETCRAVADAIGKNKTAIRLSPYGVFNDMGPCDLVEDTYETFAARLNDLGIAYIHTVDHSSLGAPEVPDSMKNKIRAAFKGAIILSGGYDLARAKADLDAGKGDLVAFARAFLANPDLVQRMKQDAPVNMPASMDLFYTPGAEGYTDYPTLDV